MESRLSRNKVSPYKKIKSGDQVSVKHAGELLGWFIAGEVKFFTGREQIKQMWEEYNDQICADNAWIEKKKDSKFATLIEVTKLTMFKEPKELNFEEKRKARLSWYTLLEVEDQVEKIDEVATVW